MAEIRGVFNKTPGRMAGNAAKIEPRCFINRSRPNGPMDDPPEVLDCVDGHDRARFQKGASWNQIRPEWVVSILILYSVDWDLLRPRRGASEAIAIPEACDLESGSIAYDRP